MARRGGLQSIDPEQLEPFGRLIYEYLLSFRPNKTVNEFAAQCNISGQTVWDWIHGNTSPRASTVALIASATGLSRDELLKAAGLPTNTEKASERRQNRKAAEDIIAYLRSELSARFSPEEMLAVDAYLADGLRDYLNGQEPMRPESQPMRPPLPMERESKAQPERARH